MKKRLIIISAGAFGREVAGWAMDVLVSQRDWEIHGFLDNRADILNEFDFPYSIIDAPDKYQPGVNDVFICAIGDPKIKLQYCAQLSARGALFTTLIHPTAVVGPQCRIGAGSILCPYAVITTNVTLGPHVTLNVHASVGHDAILDEGTTLSGHCDVTGFAKLGRGVFMGTHATVLPHATVGDFAVIGAGSVVLRRVKAGETVLGVPAKTIKFSPSK